MFGPRFVLERQPQIIWQQAAFDNANDGLGRAVQVDLCATSGATGRLGQHGQWTMAGENGQL